MSLFSGARYAGPSGFPGASERSEPRRHGPVGAEMAVRVRREACRGQPHFIRGQLIRAHFQSC